MKTPIREWIKENQIKETMLWKRSAEDEFSDFIRLCDKFNGCVVSTHTSKSILLPVIMLEYKEIKMYLRDNFHNVAVTIESEKELHINEELVDVSMARLCYFEGFDRGELPVYPTRTPNAISFHLWNEPIGFIFGFLASL